MLTNNLVKKIYVKGEDPFYTLLPIIDILFSL